MQGGARVGETQINSKKKEWILKYINTAGIYGRYDTKEEANDIAKRINRGDSGMHVAVMTVSGVPGETVHAIDITPAMRDSVLTDGQALFQKQKPYPLRPGEVRPRHQQLSLWAIGDLDKAGQVVSTTTGAVALVTKGSEDGKTVGLAFSPQLIHKGVVNLKGSRVTSAEDLAKLAQVYRDPRFETFCLLSR